MLLGKRESQVAERTDKCRCCCETKVKFVAALSHQYVSCRVRLAPPDRSTGGRWLRSLVRFRCRDRETRRGRRAGGAVSGGGVRPCLDQCYRGYWSLPSGRWRLVHRVRVLGFGHVHHQYGNDGRAEREQDPHCHH